MTLNMQDQAELFSVPAIVIWAAIMAAPWSHGSGHDSYRLAVALAHLDLGIRTADALHSLIDTYHSPHARVARGLDGPCTTPNRSVTSSWDFIVSRINEGHATLPEISLQMFPCYFTQQAVLVKTECDLLVRMMEAQRTLDSLSGDTAEAKHAARKWQQSLALSKALFDHRDEKLIQAMAHNLPRV